MEVVARIDGREVPWLGSTDGRLWGRESDPVGGWLVSRCKWRSRYVTFMEAWASGWI